MQVVWLWPNVDAGSDDVAKGLRVFREKHRPDYMHFYRNFAVEDYARLINGASCVVGNSSSALREGAFLGVPSVNIGTRQRGRERGPNVVDVPCQASDIEQAVREQLSVGRYMPSHLFGDGKAGERIADKLASMPLRLEKTLNYLTQV